MAYWRKATHPGAYLSGPRRLLIDRLATWPPNRVRHALRVLRQLLRQEPTPRLWTSRALWKRIVDSRVAATSLLPHQRRKALQVLGHLELQLNRRKQVRRLRRQRHSQLATRPASA